MLRWIFLFLLLLAFNVQAEEVIGRFLSEIEITRNGEVKVTETIDVFAENIEIRRGIFRDFPTQYFGAWLTTKQVGFAVLSVTRNGQTEPFHTQKMSNGIRLYIGSADVFLQPGDHLYQITYKTNKQLGYFEDYDEFYWNVTGTGWSLPIKQVSVIINLPNGANQQVLDQRAWTGYQGQQEQNYKINNSDSTLGFITTKTLQPYQGLTVGIQIPKGILNPEPFDFSAFLAANLLWILAVLSLLFYLGFYLSAWLRCGRDPEKGVVITRFYPPKGISAAAVHYINSEKTNDKTLTAAILSLAVKGFLRITQNKSEYRLKRVNTNHKKPLSKAETALFDRLFKSRSKNIIISKQYNSTIKNAKSKLFTTLKKEYKKKCFIDNRSYVLWGWFISFICFVLGTLQIYSNTLTASEFFIFLFTACVFFAMVLMFLAAAPLLFGLIILGVLVASSVELFQILIEHLAFVYFLLFLLGVNVLFVYLLRAPTPFGRHLKDQIDGLKMYMSSAEENRLNLMNPPNKTIEHYEELLPFAIALGLENQWSEKFTDVLELQSPNSKGTGSNYQPSWYQSKSKNQTFTGFSANQVSRTLQKTVSSASVIPSSSGSSSSGSYSGSSSSGYSSGSSSSSGGSSGGGGGGGGGGGW